MSLTKEQLTERFYAVREQRNRLLWACEKALAAYDAARETGKGNWSGKDVDAMRALVAQVKTARLDTPSKKPDTTIRCPDCGEVEVVSDVFEHGRGISGECPKCNYRLYYAPPIEEPDRERIAEGDYGYYQERRADDGPVFTHCNVCGRKLRDPEEDEMGMCEGCANL